MNTNAAASLVTAFAYLAEMEGMKAANAACAVLNETPAYDEKAFGFIRSELMDLAHNIREYAHIQ